MTHAKLMLVAVSILAAPFLASAQSAQSAPPALAASAPTAVPPLVPWSGVAVDAQGRPLGAAVSVSFQIFRDPQGGEPLWSEIQTLPLDAQGRCSADLGATLPDGLPPELFSTGEARWLEVQFAGHNAQPRVLLASVPYALKAGDAATVGGLSAADFVTRQQLAAATQTLAAVPLAQASPLTPQLTTGGTVSGGGTTNYLPVWTNSSTLGNSLLFQSGSYVGIGTTTPASPLHVATPWPAVTANGANDDSELALINGGLNIAAGIKDSGYRVGVKIANFTNDAKFLGTLSAQYGLWARVGDSSGAGAGTITNSYGVFIDNLTGGKATITHSYGLYQAAAGSTNYFAGKVGIGTTAPAATLEVNGPAKFDGLATFATGQTFPGAGTVTSVAAGAGLTGGPITTTGTLSVAAAGVTNAMLQNPSLTITAGNGLTGGGPVSLGGSTTLSLSPYVIGTTGLFSTSSGSAVLGQNTEVSDYGELGAIDSGGFEYGVYGDGGNYGTGVAGNGPSGGVYGILNTGNDTYAFGYLGSDVNDYTAGVYSAATTYGVFAAANTYGVAGESEYTGVYGMGPTYGVFSDGPTGSSAYSSTVIALPDNRVVEMYAVSSPENWLEDFGTGQLRNGSVTIALDPTFAEAVSEDASYHVFLTPNGDCDGLYVTAKTATGFEVRELHGGQASVAFDYRIVARRRGLETLRMEQLDADTETAETIRDGIRNRPAHRALILRKPQVAPASAGPSRAGIPRTAASHLPLPGLPEPPPVPARN
jgi:hypothetical protein